MGHRITLEPFLREKLHVLAGDIGERNTRCYGKLQQAHDFLARELADLGLLVSNQVFAARAGLVKRRVANLIAELPGRNPEILVIGAHYDSALGCPGANDNGTGSVAILALARALRTKRLDRTLRLALFVNEEPPYFQTDEMGSVVYARSCRENGDPIVGMLSLETLGYFSDEPGSQEFPPGPWARKYPDVGNFVALVGNKRSVGLVDDLVDGFRSSVPIAGICEHEHKRPEIGFSDQWGFWRAGYPGCMLTDTAVYRYPHYHLRTDTPDKIDYKRFAQVVRGTIWAISALVA